MSLNMELTPFISMGLYFNVSEVIGQEEVVRLRRDVLDILMVLWHCSLFESKKRVIMSGSTGEGFEMKSSDIDMMIVLDDVEVVPTYHPLPQGSTQHKCLLTYDTDCTSPGFAVLRCRFLDELNNTPNHRHISHSLVWNSLGPCVCSKMFREYNLYFCRSAEIHGPCISGELMGDEFDFAFCLQCPYWPREASSFITRSLRSGWPSQQVVTDICNDGCLFVPISSKALHCQDAVEMEWRMSFSLAEKKLIHCMTHCQFLCYGLLKLFLNEVLKKTENINNLLCSYFMKTAVFWEISEDNSGWISQNFLCKFWKVFHRLLSWVSVGYCPNFFNPENNMFAGKIHGHKQSLLMQTLRSFHDEGVLCLLKCSSLNTGLTAVLRLAMICRQLNIIPFFWSLLNEEFHVRQWYIDFRKLICILSSPVSLYSGLSHVFKAIRRIRNFEPTSSLMKDALKYAENRQLLNVGEIILSDLASANCLPHNKKAYKKYLHTALNIFYRNGNTFCESEIIVAKWFCLLGMFQNVIHILSSVQRRLNCSQFMYVWKMNEAGFERLQRPETSYNSFLKSNIANTVQVTIGTTVSELLLELQAGINDATVPILFIPPVVFVNFLLLLSYHHLGDTILRNDVLLELQALVFYDEDYHIYYENRAITWEILGICQQLCGDYFGAYQSYINALNDKFNYFKSATNSRIVSLISA